MAQPLRVAVVTPYFKEAAHVLRRCLDSVRAQTHAEVVHYMVADGFPQTELLTEWPEVRHIVLPNSHGNFGCGPRGVGAQCALTDDMDVVCYLDADNLFEPDHVASLVRVYESARAAGKPVDAVFASRYMFLPGHEHLRLVPPDEIPGQAPQGGLVDTNCISLARSAGFLWAAWAQIPRAFMPICDRVFTALILHHKLSMSWTPKPTVLYESNWSDTYRQAGLPVPETGLHDGLVSGVVAGMPTDELWDLLRVRWKYGSMARNAA